MGYNPQVGLSKIFHFLLFFFYLIKIFNAAKRCKNTVGMAVQHKVVSPNLFLLHLSTFHTRIRKLNNALIRGFCTVFCWWRSSLPGCKGLLCKQTHVRQSTGLSSLTEIPEWASGLLLHLNGSALIAAEYSQGMNI